MTINILVLDNDLDVARGEIEKALKLYLGSGASFSVPDFFSSPSPMIPLELPAVGSNPSATIYFKANKKRDKHGAIIVRQINNGDYDGVEWDAVILDNNWAGPEAENSGCTVILEALLQNDSFKKAKPEYMLFTWHLEDENYNRKVTEALASKRQFASITPVAKGSRSAIAEWFGHLLRSRAEHKYAASSAVTVQPSETELIPHRLPDAKWKGLIVCVEKNNTIKFLHGNQRTELSPFKGTGKGVPEIFVATLILIKMGVQCNGAKDVAVLLDHVRDSNIKFGADELKGKNQAARTTDLRLVDGNDALIKADTDRVRGLLVGRSSLRTDLEIVRHSYSDLKQFMQKGKYLCWPTQGGSREPSLVWVFRKAMSEGLLKLELAD